MPDKSTSSGKVYRNSELKIIDPETNEILGANQEGEFCFKGKTMMTGYWKNPEATKEAIDSEGFFFFKFKIKLIFLSIKILCRLVSLGRSRLLRR